MANNFKTTLIGNSMWPSLSSGTQLECHLGELDFEIGDLVFFKDNETQEYTIHRLISLNPIVTKGDRSYQKDSSNDILGKVIIRNRFKNLKAMASQMMLEKNLKRYLGFSLILVLSLFG